MLATKSRATPGQVAKVFLYRICSSSSMMLWLCFLKTSDVGWKVFQIRLFCHSTILSFNKPWREGYKGAIKEKLNMEIIINYDGFSKCGNVECLEIFQFVKHCSTSTKLQLVATGTKAFTNAGKI